MDSLAIDFVDLQRRFLFSLRENTGCKNIGMSPQAAVLTQGMTISHWVKNALHDVHAYHACCRQCQPNI